MNFSTTIPELVCRNIKSSLTFYTKKLGFEVLFSRQEQGFYFLEKNDIQVMLQQLGDTAWMSHGQDMPFGNGMNLALKVDNLDDLDLIALEQDTFLPVETIEYRVQDSMVKVKQVIFRDPDGYLIRFMHKVAH